MAKQFMARYKLKSGGSKTSRSGAEREPLAIVGMGCRFPGGVRDLESFWELLISGRSGITEVPRNRWNADRYYHSDPAVPGRMVTKWGGFISKLDKFDHRFWGISPREAMRMDPQQRWLLEVAWEAIEDAGVVPSQLRGRSIGVYVGVSGNDYGSLQLSRDAEIDVHTNSGGTLSIAANRISYLFDFKGPSIAIDTACSSALVAITLACQSIWSGECESALTGGVNALITPHASIGFSKASMLSPDGQCFAFDARANGYVRGEGAGLVFLKPLKMAIEEDDPIYAVIRAAVVNQDGHTSSMTVPSVESQSEMLRRAYREAGIPPYRVVYMEAHGTGTPVGDPIESTALGAVLCEGRPPGEKCLLGSVKTNIGHLESAAGVAGLMKAALVLHKGVVPPNLNFVIPNPNIPFEDLQLDVVTKPAPLPRPRGGTHVAAVNSFGFGGTNAHLVLESHPKVRGRKPRIAPTTNRPWVLPISARHKESLQAAVRAFRDFLLEDTRHLGDVCYSAGQRREHHEQRMVVLARSPEELEKKLGLWLNNCDGADGVFVGRAQEKTGPIVFVFTGQGPQWWAMGRQLLQREPVFRETVHQVDSCFFALSGWSLIEELSRPEEDSRMDQTAIAQPAIFALQVALASLWNSWGVEPAKVIGHSVGEIAAAYCAGIYSLNDAVKIIYHRSRLQDTTEGSGRMLAAGIPPAAARTVIGKLADSVQLAAINSPELVTLAGDTQQLEQVAHDLQKAGRFMRRLPVNYAFHTHQMEPIREALLDALSDLKPGPSHIQFMSTVTGGMLPGEKLDAEYWWHNVRSPVLFAPAISSILLRGEHVFLEIGPHPSLKSSLNDCVSSQKTKGPVFHSLRRESDETLEMLQNLAKMFVHGVPIDWGAVNQNEGNFVRIPHYPWRYDSCWLAGDGMASRLQAAPHPLLDRRTEAANPTWQVDLDPRVFPYLQDHRLWDSIIFPASGYPEIGLAVARELFPDQVYVVEDVEIKKALFVSTDRVPKLQVVFDREDASFAVHSADVNKDWELNASGRLVELPPRNPDTVDLAILREPLKDRIAQERYYDEIASIGYQFGPSFSLIRNVWRNHAEALAEIVVPETLSDTLHDYCFHPAVLDACFQASRGALAALRMAVPADQLYLPESIRRVRRYPGKLPDHLWAHAVLRDEAEESILADIYVYNDFGQRVADIFGFRATRMDRKRQDDDLRSCLYQFRWEQQSFHALPESDAADADRAILHGSEVHRGSTSIHGEKKTRATYVIFADRAGFAESLFARMKWDGGDAICIRAGNEFRQLDETHTTLRPDSEQDLWKVFTTGKLSDTLPPAIVHCWSLDRTPADRASGDLLHQDQEEGVLNLMRLARVLDKLDMSPPPRVYLITRDARHVLDRDRSTGIASAPIVGLARVANNECPQFRWTSVDLGLDPSGEEAKDLLSEIRTAGEELEVAYRGSRRFVCRLHRVSAAELPERRQNAIRSDGVIPFKLQTHKPGVLTHLSWNRTRRRDPGPGEIEVLVKAGGVNFRDVMKALGIYPGRPKDRLWFGDDFSGTVLRVGDSVIDVEPGDDVVGLAPYCFRAYVDVDRRMVFKKPRGMSFASAATIPTVFITSHDAIHDLARMRPGETILIHSGTGGIGQAAIQVARRLGLEVFATAGTPEKRQMLLDTGVSHVMDSRTLQFADQILEITSGRGVDAVLNSLGGKFIQKSLSVLAPFGRFLEIGKIDIHNNRKIGMRLFRNNISYHVIDLTQLFERRPHELESICSEVARRMAAGDYHPLPHTLFPAADVVEAFRHMAQGRHVGKNVLSFQVDDLPIGPCTDPRSLFSPDASYLITGGAGGFGFEVAKWMTRHGARHLTLLSRTGPRDEKTQREIEGLRAGGVDVLETRGDVTKMDDLLRVIGQVGDELPELKGVIHSAMVLEDEFLMGLDEPRFRRALDPKMLGAWNLHLATQDLPLDHFICFSSFSAIVGGARQANYNAGNAFLDSLAHYRHSIGLPSLTINWGTLAGAGFVERNPRTAAYLDKIGLKSLTIDEALRVLARMILLDPVQVAAGRVDWRVLGRMSPVIGRSNTYRAVTGELIEDRSRLSIRRRVQVAEAEERLKLVEDYLAQQVAGVFCIESKEINRTSSMNDLGLDSLMAVEFVSRVEGELGMSLPLGRVLSGPTINDLAQALVRMISGSEESSTITREKGGASGGRALPMEKADVQHKTFPLSESQHFLWRGCRSSGYSGTNLVIGASIRPAVDREAMSDVFTCLFRRHPMLGARFLEIDGQPRQQMQARARVDLVFEDATGMKSKALRTRLVDFATRPFDLGAGSPVRLGFFRTATDSQIALLSVHRMVADEWSVTLLFRDLMESYCSQRAGRPSHTASEFSYQDFVNRETEQLKNSEWLHEFWQAKLAGAPLSLCSETDALGTLKGGSMGSTYAFRLEAELTMKLLVLSAEQDTPLAMILLSALEILIHRSTHQSDLVVGYSLVSHRHPDLHQVVGNFSTTLPMRSRMNNDPTFLEFLIRNKQELETVLDLPPLPLSRLEDQLYSSEERPPASLFRVAFSMCHFPEIDDLNVAMFLLRQSGHRVRFDEMTVESIDLGLPQAESNLTLVLSHAGDTIFGSWDYGLNDVDEESIARWNALYLDILQQIVRDPVRRVSELIPHVESEPVAKLVKAISDGSRLGSSAQTSSRDLDFESEAQLDSDIIPPSENSSAESHWIHALLTGATGFIGAFLLSELLKKTRMNITCLVRASGVQHGMARVLENLHRYNLRPDALEDRVEILVGDLSKPKLGLTTEDFDALAREVDVIYHSGAVVNLVMPYSALRSANVLGTQEILRLACRIKTKPTHVVSTFTVHQSRSNRRAVVYESDPLPPCEALLDGYSQTKWVAEKLIDAARRRGLPVTLYRPGHVTGHSQTGASKTDDLLHTLVLTCIRLGKGPLLKGEFDVTPVDYVAQAMVELSRSPRSLGQTFHLTNPNPVTAGEFIRWMQNADVGVQPVSYEEWRAQLRELAVQGQSGVLKLLGEVFAPRALAPDNGEPATLHPRFDCSRTLSALSDRGIACPAADTRLFSTYLEYLLHNELVH